MLAQFDDLTGHKFTRLVALFPAPAPDKTYWICRCRCGREVAVPVARLRSENTRSCGCLKSEMSREFLLRTSIAAKSAEWHTLLDTISDDILTRHPQTPQEIRGQLRSIWGHCEERRFWRAMRTLVEQGRAERNRQGCTSVYTRSIPWRRNLGNCLADAAAAVAVYELGYRRAA